MILAVPLEDDPIELASLSVSCILRLYCSTLYRQIKKSNIPFSRTKLELEGTCSEIQQEAKEQEALQIVGSHRRSVGKLIAQH